MGLFRKPAVAPPPSPDKQPEVQNIRRKDVEFRYPYEQGRGYLAEDAALQIQQDLRDELKEIKALLKQMDENFRIVFGVEKKDDPT